MHYTIGKVQYIHYLIAVNSKFLWVYSWQSLQVHLHMYLYLTIALWCQCLFIHFYDDVTECFLPPLCLRSFPLDKLYSLSWSNLPPKRTHTSRLWSKQHYCRERGTEWCHMANKYGVKIQQIFQLQLENVS